MNGSARSAVSLVPNGSALHGTTIPSDLLEKLLHGAFPQEREGWRGYVRHLCCATVSDISFLGL